MHGSLDFCHLKVVHIHFSRSTCMATRTVQYGHSTSVKDGHRHSQTVHYYFLWSVFAFPGHQNLDMLSVSPDEH